MAFLFKFHNCKLYFKTDLKIKLLGNKMSTRSRANKRNNKEIEAKENVEIDPQVPQAKKNNYNK